MADPTSSSFLNGRVTLHAGDCLAVLPTLDENSVDSVCCDPPYHLASIVKRWSGNGPPPVEGVYRRSTSGFMGKAWDGGDIAFDPATWAAVLRVMKPGAHLVAFAAPKNSHRLACAIEDAGFEIRDTLMWLFGSGFPKSHDVSKGIDRAAGAEREIIGRAINGAGNNGTESVPFMPPDSKEYNITSAATDSARQWEGWGTALKPA